MDTANLGSLAALIRYDRYLLVACTDRHCKARAIFDPLELMNYYGRDRLFRDLTLYCGGCGARRVIYSAVEPAALEMVPKKRHGAKPRPIGTLPPKH
jgi:hypothetical protein